MVALAIFPRGHVAFFPEDSDEVTVVAESALKGDSDDRFVAGLEKFAGGIQPNVQQIIRRRRPEDFLKRPNEF